MSEHHTQVIETATRYGTIVSGSGVSLGAALDWLNANASALGLLITLGAFITNLYYQRKLYKLRAAQVEAGKHGES